MVARPFAMAEEDRLATQRYSLTWTNLALIHADTVGSVLNKPLIMGMNTRFKVPSRS